MTRRIWLFMAIVAFAGCGPSAGDRYQVPRITEMYFHKADAEDGGPKGNWYQLATSGRMAYIQESSEVKVLEPGKPWIKVEVTEGREKGATGWIEAKALGDKR